MTIFDYIGNTPLYTGHDEDNHLFFKFEGMNSFGSSKDRAAHYVLSKLYREGVINQETTIIESSSGNMGIALAAVCKNLGNHFICVIDPHISAVNEFIITSLGAETLKVTDADENNSYLKTRLKNVHRLLEKIPNSYWFNQYGNVLVCEAYESIGEEMIREVPDVDYVFIAVSSAGTIGGLSPALKRHNPNIKIIAVDVLGSKVFDPSATQKRYLSGIGSSIKADNLDRAMIDEVMLVDEKDGVKACYDLLNNEAIFGGGSSGCVYHAIKKYIADNNLKDKKIIGLLNDRGDRYFKTIYSREWVKEKFDIDVYNLMYSFVN